MSFNINAVLPLLFFLIDLFRAGKSAWRAHRIDDCFPPSRGVSPLHAIATQENAIHAARLYFQSGKQCDSEKTDCATCKQFHITQSGGKSTI